MNATRQSKPGNPTPRRRKSLDRVIGSRLGKLLGRIGRTPRRGQADSLFDLADALLSLRGRASGPALASAFFDLYEQSDIEARREFIAKVHDLHPHDSAAIDAAIIQWNENRNESAAAALNAAAQSQTHKLIRMLNMAPQGTKRLLAMRRDLLEIKQSTAGIKAFDRDLERSFTAWFNAGFLELRRIRWDSPANLLEHLIEYEAVHEIDGWDDLRSRVEPLDRRCYGFFHPQMANDPLIFVEVALTRELPSAIHDIIGERREHVPPREASCAIFYSISNCQEGLRGVPFGNYLIKRVVRLLQEELPELKTFATLSPMPGFAKWLKQQSGAGAKLPSKERLRALAAEYLAVARHDSGQPVDPVARFHLGNGARLEAIHADADLSANGQKQAHGVMVNYVYDLAEIEANHFALTELGTVAVSKTVQSLIDTRKQNGKTDTAEASGDIAA